MEVIDSQVVVDLSCMAWKEGQNRKCLSGRDMRGTASLTCFDFVSRNDVWGALLLAMTCRALLLAVTGGAPCNDVGTFCGSC